MSLVSIAASTPKRKHDMGVRISCDMLRARILLSATSFSIWPAMRLKLLSNRLIYEKRLAGMRAFKCPSPILAAVLVSKYSRRVNGNSHARRIIQTPK